MLQNTDKLLRKERENFYNILNTINDLIYIVNSKFEIEFVNAALEEEYDKGAVGNICYEYFNGFDEMCPWCTIKKVLKGDTVRWEKTRTQNQKTYDIIDTPLKNLDGSISLLSILRDITERKHTEEALRESEQKFRTFMETLPQPVWIYQDYQCRYANSAAEQITGFSTEELSSIPFWDFLHPDYKDIAIEGKKALETGLSLPITDAIVKIITKSGTEKWLDTRLEFTDYENKRVTLITAMDVTERIEAEEAMRRSEERLRAFMDSATDGFNLLDSNLNFIDINKTGLKRLGLSREEVIGKNILEIFPFLKESKTYEKYLEVLRTGSPYYIDDIDSVPLIRQKYYSIRGFKVGKGLGIIFTDITNRVKAEKTREELEQRRDSFVWMTSHELRTPLTVLTGYCDFLMEHINDLAQKRITNILGVIKSNLDRLERLTSKVSTIGQIERGIFEIENTSINFCDFLQDTLEPYHQLLGNQFEFRGCLEDTSIIINGDPHRLQQVIDNIIGNAIKQTDKEHRKIDIQTKISLSKIQIEVTDNGAGIEAKNLDVIFDQFVSIPTEFSATGTGIGLYLCQKTLEAHGGRISAKSKGPGHGATFIIELPRKDSKQARKKDSKFRLKHP
ncbi:MAG: PAS domain S-box protein [Candidatus Thorarchaeota archaeon]